MEKLQSAIEKAREKRSSDPAERAAKSQQRQVKRAGSPAARWSEIKPYEPDIDLLTKNRIVTLTPSAEANPFDILRTKVLLQMRQNGWKRLAVTSPTPECGKTTTACNLAFGMSRQSDLRTMLLDFDLHRPAVGKYLNISSGDAIQRILEEQGKFSELTHCYGGNLIIASARRPTADPTRLLMSGRVGELVDEIQNDYDPDLMIFDLPPLLSNDTTRSFLKNVDCALIMARAGSTTVSQIDNCEREVAELTNVLGIALNHCTYIEDGQKYDYY
ncbi:CpsD/CapB family tyrosine-protein kinase [Aliiroseovarius sp. PTFE2010]|uniref:CpsD/CapB family tyrosine-protein kinase n=1 Tax=Aliiroseovarius sp. PTFE2010 TaxID=3417190 RepID=UPI003CF6CDB1